MADSEVDGITKSLAETDVKQFNVLRLAGKGHKLDTVEDVADLVRSINEAEDVHALSLEGNTLGVEAAQAIAEALSKRPEFEKALWNDMFTGRLRSEIPKVLNCFGDALITAKAHLTELDLCDNAFGPDGMAAVSKLLTSETCFTLKVLKFNNNGLGIGGGKILSEALLECHSKSTEAGKALQLKTFIAGRNRLENEGATALAKAFEALGTLEEIAMPQNGINHEGVTALAKSFEANKNLKVINLNDNTFVAKGAISMAKVLKKLSNLEVINFGDCVVKTNGAICIGKALRNSNPNLKELVLAFGDIRKTAIAHLIEALKNKDDLRKVDFNGNCFGEEGVQDVRARLGALKKEDVLESLSDDEGDEDDDEDEGDEDEGEESDEESLGDEKELVGDKDEKEQDTSKDKNLSNAKEFLLRPSLELYNTIPKSLRVNLVKEALKAHITDINSICKTFVLVSSVLKDNDTFLQCTGSILQEIFLMPVEHDIMVNSLLVQMGLLKSEEKIKPITDDITGALIALEHAVKESYFPKELALYFTAFLNRSNSITESSPSARDKLLETLRNFLIALSSSFQFPTVQSVLKKTGAALHMGSSEFDDDTVKSRT